MRTLSITQCQQVAGGSTDHCGITSFSYESECTPEQQLSFLMLTGGLFGFATGAIVSAIYFTHNTAAVVAGISLGTVGGLLSLPYIVYGITGGFNAIKPYYI